MRRLTGCKPYGSGAYQLALAFDDGLVELLDFGPVVQHPTFSELRARTRFVTARVTQDGEMLEWPATCVRLRAHVLWRLASRGDWHVRVTAVESTAAQRERARAAQVDASFQRFMGRTVAPAKMPRPRRGGPANV